MNTRIKMLRKMLDLTQQAFAERIGLKQNSIALIESGKRNISDYSVRVICREFNVNEEWLRNGEGEIFKASPSDALDALAKESHLTHGDYIMIEKFLRMKPEAREAIIRYMVEVSEALRAGDVPANTPAYPSDYGVAAAEAAYEKELWCCIRHPECRSFEYARRHRLK